MARAGLEPDGGACSPTTSTRARARPMPPIGEAKSSASPTLLRFALATCPVQADLAWASFPCQDLSLAGAGAGLDGSPLRGLLGLLLGDACAGAGRPRAARDRARECSRRAHLERRGGFRCDLRGAARPRLPLRSADDRRRAFSPAVATARVLCSPSSRRRPARLAVRARPAATSRLGRAQARRLGAPAVGRRRLALVARSRSRRARTSGSSIASIEDQDEPRWHSRRTDATPA